MPLIECPECKNMISDTAKMCPKCGYKKKRSKKPFIIASAIVLTAVAVVLAILLPRLLKPGYEKALGRFVDACFNGECSVEDVSELVPKDYWGERKFSDIYSVKKVAERARYNRKEITQKYGYIEFDYRIKNSKKMSSAEIKDIEKRLSWLYESIDIDIKEAYKLNFVIYCSEANLEHEYTAYAVYIDDNWYICQTGESFPDTEGICDFAIVGYENEYVKSMIS